MKTTDHRPGASPPRGTVEEAVTREHIRAATEVKRGEHDPALQRYRRILCADPGDGIASRNLVWLATGLDLSSELAAKAGQWTLCQCLDNPRTKFLTGRTLFWRGRIAKAIPLLGASTKDGPDPNRAFSLLGEAVSLRSDVEDNPSLGGPVPGPIGHRLVAFVRDMVSMDHVLPIIWRWTNEGLRDAVVVFFGPIQRVDWRIDAARSMRHVHVRTLLDLAPELDIDDMLRCLLGEATGRVVVYDQTNYAMARVFGGAARRHGAPFVAMPQGEVALTNFLTKPRDMVAPQKTEPDAGLYDLSIHSSGFTIAKLGLEIGPSTVVLGSARYCRGWLRQLKQWIPPVEGLPSEDTLRLVLFLPKPDFIVNWEELEAVLAMLGRRAGATLLVKAHPRHGGRHRLTQRNGKWDIEITELAGRDMLARIITQAPDAGWVSVAPEIESSTLVDWADVVLSLGTSVTWQAVAANKPVLELSWCHGNRTTMSKFLPSTDMRCRDDLLDALDRIEANGPDIFYASGERAGFIESFIDPTLTSDENAVLDAYVETLEGLATQMVGLARKQ